MLQCSGNIFGKKWKRIFEFWFPLSKLDILFGIQNETFDEIIDTLNYCVLFAKFYIYRTKNSENKVLFFEFVHLKKQNRGFENNICI